MDTRVGELEMAKEEERGAAGGHHGGLNSRGPADGAHKGGGLGTPSPSCPSRP